MILFSRLFLASLAAVLTLPGSAVFARPQADDIPERPRSEMILPETTVALLQVPNFQDALEKLKETNMGRMMADESIAPLIDGFREETETTYEDVKEEVGLEFSDLTSLPDGEITFAVIAPRRQNPEYLVMMELNEEDGVLDRVMERSRVLIEQQGAIVQEVVEEDKLEEDELPEAKVAVPEPEEYCS